MESAYIEDRDSRKAGTIMCLLASMCVLNQNGLVKICIHGFGNVGSALAKLWVTAGHSVEAGLRPGSGHEETARGLGVRIVEPAAGAQKAEVNVLALPWAAVEDALRSLGPLTGKVLVDATNPLDRDLSVLRPPAGSAGLQVAKWAPGAHVVKAFNTIGAGLYGNDAFDALYCGDDPAALDTVRRLIADTKMKPVFVGPLKNAGYLEHIAGLWIDLSVQGRVDGAFGFNLVKGAF
jgi:predicted dinucleotide-binding enzyme